MSRSPSSCANASSGELEPGAWIDELKIAEEYGISRTPLREALKVLAAEGLVTMKLRRGAYVTEVSRKDISDVYRLLSLLEADAAAEVAGKATDEQLQRLQQTHEELKRNTADAERFCAQRELSHADSRYCR
jgi:DNA-binding GntR family transcriptional regulator